MGLIEKKRYMVTCKWCYLQIIPRLEDRHIECKKKIRKQIRIRKAGIKGLATASDKRFIGETNNKTLKVIGSRYVKA